MYAKAGNLRCINNVPPPPPQYPAQHKLTTVI